MGAEADNAVPDQSSLPTGMPLARGWCPGALRPMLSGDGLVVRVRPRLARLTREQTLGLCDAALRYGSGQIELTNRANLQIRGVGEAGWPALIETLGGLGLLDVSAQQEARRNILLAPDWREGDDSHRIAQDLLLRLAQLPADEKLPAKLGFAVDAGAGVMLRQSSADFRIERGCSGGLILRADGRDLGAPITKEGAAQGLIELARWFIASGGEASGRMARHSAPLPDWAREQEAPASAGPPWQPGPHALGTIVGLDFGQIDASVLMDAVRRSDATAIRVTPWRLLMLEGAAPLSVPGLSLDADWNGQRIDACVGLPNCLQASVETRALAYRLAPLIKGRLHVSGCAKGCACSRPADVCVIGRNGKFDIAFNARADDQPRLSGLNPEQVFAFFGTS